MLRRLPLFALALLFVGGNTVHAQQARSIAEVDAAGLKKAIAGLKGKVVFVNFWATWCAPCIAEFPDIVRLHQKYHARGFEVIAVSFDEQKETAIPFLNRQKADFIQLQKSPKQEDETFRIGFDKVWAGALPASWLFDQNGNKVYFHMAKFDPIALDKQIGELLAKKE
jgi:thiol-disulfide isomerase/thioredoxin